MIHMIKIVRTVLNKIPPDNSNKMILILYKLAIIITIPINLKNPNKEIIIIYSQITMIWEDYWKKNQEILSMMISLICQEETIIIITTLQDPEEIAKIFPKW